MCGRYSFVVGPDAASQIGTLELRYGAQWLGGDLESARPRYNIAPTQTVLTVQGVSADPTIASLRWGIPGPRESLLINARADKLGASRMWKPLVEARRCLIPADGFYEWRASESGGQKVPVWFSLADGDQFAFAGLWTKWKQDGQDHVGCVIITTTPNDLVAPVHNRMPAILLDGRARQWLDGSDDLVTESWLTEHLAPVDSVKMTARIVSTAVNSPMRDDPSCREAA